MRPEEEFRYLVLAAQREGNRMLANAFRPLGLTPSQAEVIRVLEDHQPLTLVALGELLVCETGSPSRLVSAMVDRGLVERRPSASDRRTITLVLAQAGRVLARHVAEVEQALYERIAQTAGPADLQQVNAVLRTFVKGLPTGSAVARRAEVAPDQDQEN